MGILSRLFGSKQEIDFDEIKKSLLPKVEGLKRETVRIVKTSESRKSKFGGLPLIDEESFEWPRSNGKPMAFLAQIDLEELSNVHEYDWLSKNGVLLFFYDVYEMPWGFDPKDRGKWKVFFERNPNTFAQFPEDMSTDFHIK